jgi:hypothetical protein
MKVSQVFIKYQVIINYNNLYNKNIQTSCITCKSLMEKKGLLTNYKL